MLELPHRLHKWMIVSVIMPYSISLRFNHYRADYVSKDHKPSATECKARLRGLERSNCSKTIIKMITPSPAPAGGGGASPPPGGGRLGGGLKRRYAHLIGLKGAKPRRTSVAGLHPSMNHSIRFSFLVFRFSFPPGPRGRERGRCGEAKLPCIPPAVHAAPPHHAAMNIRLFLGGRRPPRPFRGWGDGETGFPHPRAGGHGETGFPHAPLREPMFTLESWH